MSEFVREDWKLKARTVVKLYRENINRLAKAVRDQRRNVEGEMWSEKCGKQNGW